MNFQKASFERASGGPADLPVSDLPEIVFSGKSNVGKSSLINKLVQRKALARTSATPGKTATINSFLVDTCRFIDLPGYGYAKVSKTEKLRWAKLVEAYFNSERRIALVIQILDMRHPPSADDMDMLNYLENAHYPYLVVCTKSDKLNQSETKKQIEQFQTLLSETDACFYPFSATKGSGLEEIKAAIEQFVT